MIGIDNKKIRRVAYDGEYGPVVSDTKMTLLEFAEWYRRLMDRKPKIIPNGVNGFIAVTEKRYFDVHVVE